MAGNESESSLNNETESLPAEIDEVLREIPEEKRTLIKERISVFMSGQEPESAISRKMTPEHISTYLKDAGDDMRLTHRERSQSRLFVFIIGLFVFGLIGMVILTFQDKPDMIEKVIFAVGGCAAGFIGGFGYGRSKRDE